MKKLQVFFHTLSLYLFAAPALLLAAETDKPVVACPPGSFNALCNLSASNIGSTVGILVTFAFVGAVLVALGFLIWGGVKWIASGGDKTALEEARNHIVAAVVGLVIVFLVYFILNLVVFFFTGSNIFNLKIPSLSPNPQPNP